MTPPTESRGPCPSVPRSPRPRQALCGLAVAAGLLAMPGAPAQSQVRLPAMGESVSESMPVGAERRLGDQILLEVRRDPAYLDDPVLVEYLQSLWQPLVAAARRRGEIGDDLRDAFAWESFLVRDHSINAFALPGGYVGAHLGLIAATSTRDELVSVLAHELSHVTQRHIARSIESASRQSALGMAAMVLGILAASRSHNPDVARAAITGGQAAILQGQLNFSRDMEREADRLGQGLMAAAGFGAAGMPAMFEKLDKAYRLNDSGAFPYLRSHPLTDERIAEARARAGLDAVLAPKVDSEHELMRARSRVLMQPSVDAARAHVEALRAVPRARAAPAELAYAAALAGIVLKDREATADALARLAVPATDRAAARWAALLRTEAQVELGLAQPVLDAAVTTDFVNAPRPELIWHARVLLGRPGDAVAETPAFRALHQALRGRTVSARHDASLWELLARCEQARGNRLAMLRATAESQLAGGQLDVALVTLQSAREQSRGVRDADGVELAVIDARIHDLRRLRTELKPQRQP